MGSFDKFTDRVRTVLTFAQDEAQRFNHDYIGTEHILLGLIREGEGVGAEALRNLGVDLAKARLTVEFAIGQGDRPAAGQVGLTPGGKRVIEFSIDEARRHGHRYIGTEHLLLGLVRESEGIAAGVLESLGVSLDMARREVLRLLSASSQEGATDEEAQRALDQSQSHSDRAQAIVATAGLQRLRNIALGMLGSIPTVGPIIERMVDVAIPSERQSRIDDFQAKLAAAVDAAELTLADLPQTPDDYAEIVETVLEDVIRASEEDKRQAYAAVLINGLFRTEQDEERLLYLDLLRRSRTIHIRLLAALTDPATEFSSHLLHTLKSRLPEYEHDLIRLAWSDLHTWGLVAAGADHLQDSTLLAGDRRLTRLLTAPGIRYVRFISLTHRGESAQ